MARGRFVCHIYLMIYLKNKSVKDRMRHPSNIVNEARNNKIQKKLIEIYETLYNHYGPQHWWPGETALWTYRT